MSVWWTVERYLAHGCLAFCRWFPRVSVNLLITWGLLSYFRVVAALGWGQFAGIVLGLLGLTIAVILYYSYYVIWKWGPGSPLDYTELIGDEESVEVPDVIKQSVQAKHNGSFRHCSKCQCWKPDRTHHCSSCRRCHLKMDHHCPWFSACIGFRNHKYFIQLIWYTVLFCVLGFAISAYVLIRFVRAELYEEEFIDINTVLYCVMCLAFSVAITAFAVYSTWLLCINKTTLEMLEGGGSWRTSLPSSQFRYREAPNSRSLGNIFDLGRDKNLRQVMGETWLEWLLPIEPTRPVGFDGMLFPINKEMYQKAEERAQTELSLLSRQRV